MDTQELSEFIQNIRARLDLVVKANPAVFDRRPTRQFDKQRTQCPKCNWYIPDEDYIEHFDACRYECGLCGHKDNNFQAIVNHRSRCAAQYDRDGIRNRR